MTRINRTEPIQEMIAGLRLDTIKDIESLPLELEDKVQPTFDLRPKGIVNAVGSNNHGSSGSKTLFNVAKNKRSFFVAGTLSWARDAAADGTFCVMKIRLLGETTQRTIMSMEGVTLPPNGEGRDQVLSLSHAIELEPGTAVQIQQSFTAGKNYMAGSALIYEVEF